MPTPGGLAVRLATGVSTGWLRSPASASRSPAGRASQLRAEPVDVTVTGSVPVQVTAVTSGERHSRASSSSASRIT